VAIILVLRFLFYRNLNTALRRLKELHEENLVKEAELKEELERAKSERVSEVEKGKDEARKIVEEAKKEAQVIRNRLENEGREKAERIINESKEELAKLKKQLVDETERDALELSLEMIKYTLTSHIKERLHYELVEEIIGEIDKIEKEKFSVKQGKVKVTCSYPLKEEEKGKIIKILYSKLDCDVELEERVDPEIIGGLILEIGAFVIDGSLRSKFKRAMPFIKKEKGAVGI
jgi:F0F1-type ATP synthase delta subunit